MITVLTAAGIVAATAGSAGAAGSQFEFYTNTSKEDLKVETEEMGQTIKGLFRQASVAKQQQKIDFAEYFSNLKKTVLFATKLANYSEYETDLRFARDNEIFKDLPEERERSATPGSGVGRKDFVRNKYERMKKNTEEEIETYDDLIRLCLDACETIVDNDLSGILSVPAFQSKIDRFTESADYRAYLHNRKGFGKRWPMLENRLSAQFSRWRPERPSPDDPILNPQLIGAL